MNRTIIIGGPETELRVTLTGSQMQGQATFLQILDVLKLLLQAILSKVIMPGIAFPVISLAQSYARNAPKDIT